MRNKLKIKVCGMRDPDNIRQLCELLPDYIGFIFFPGSGRFVGEQPDSRIFGIPGRDIQKVGVFVNEEAEMVLRYYERFRLDMVQLHGDESSLYCAKLKDKGVRIIKAIDPYRDLDNDRIAELAGSVEYVLIDNPSTSFGGSGKKFDWDVIGNFDFPVPFLLSGGIGPEDAERIKLLRNNSLHGVDINSKFEKSAGVKEIEKVRNFIEIIRKK